jgi:hypothetical protein
MPCIVMAIISVFRDLLLPLSGSKMDVAWISETLVTIYDIIWCHNQEAHSLVFHLCKSHRSIVIAVY